MTKLQVEKPSRKKAPEFIYAIACQHDMAGKLMTVIAGSNSERAKVRGRTGIVFVGVLASLCLHALLFSPLFFSAGHPPHRLSNDQGDEASGVPAMTVLSLEEPDESNFSRSDRPADLLAAMTPTKFLIPVGGIRLGTTGALVTIEDVDPDKTTEESGQADEAGHALMYGRYIGQVTARVERAWLRPRTPIGDENFSCLVQVEQDLLRNVMEVTLKRCNGSAAWQIALVRAIESASPLPAPPDPAVFSRTLNFEMTGSEFHEGDSAEGYEPPPARVASLVDRSQTDKRMESILDRLKAPVVSGEAPIDLRIEGTRAN